ncbi:hypothetical protein [Mollivirus kamchatka]|nr:hypothetical protein [Mollivirus kamchatka]
MQRKKNKKMQRHYDNDVATAMDRHRHQDDASIATSNSIVVARKDDLYESFLAAVLASPEPVPLRFHIILTPLFDNPTDLAAQLDIHSAPPHAWESLRLILMGPHYLASPAYVDFASRFKDCICVCKAECLDAISLDHAKASGTRLVSEAHLFDLACAGQGWKWRRRVIDEMVRTMRSLDLDFPDTDVRDFYYGMTDDNHETSFKRSYSLLRGTTTMDVIKSKGAYIRHLSAATVDARVREAKCVSLSVPAQSLRRKSKTDSNGGDDDDDGPPAHVQVLMGCGDTAIIDTVCALANASPSGVGVVVCWWPSYDRTIVTICSKRESNVDAKRLARRLCADAQDSSMRGSAYYSEVSVPRLFFPWDKNQAAEVGWTIVDKEESDS